VTTATTRPRIAFYAPLKPPDHPIPSGDRTYGRLFLSVLERAGYDPFLASSYISYQRRPSRELFAERRQGGLAERDRVLTALEAMDEAQRPDMWFTYHPYCKAPDWLGPDIAERLSIPYVTAEACRTSQNTLADWADGRDAVAEALAKAEVNLCMNKTASDYLETILPDTGTIESIFPFMDISAYEPAKAVPPYFSNGNPTIITIGMMRPGKKTECHLALAASLRTIVDTPWNLIVVGDGRDRQLVEEAFSFVPEDRIRFTGTLDAAAIAAAFEQSDLFAWAGIAEPIGLVYLEAQLFGLPVAAQRSMGVPNVMIDGETGLLTPEGDVKAYGAAIKRLLGDPELRQDMGRNATRFVTEERSMEPIIRLVKNALDPLLFANARDQQH